MSTRSFVGTLSETGTFKARYVHSNGYPSHNAHVLADLVARDGVERVLEVLTAEHYGWSFLSDDTPDITGVTPDENAPCGSAAETAHRFGPEGFYGDGRFAVVPGYGIAYTTVSGQSGPDDWTRGEVNLDSGHVTGLNDTWCEWGYIFDLNGERVLHVIEVASQTEGVSDEIVKTVPVADFGSTDWSKIECGDNFERCSHYAWFHDDTVPEDARDLNMVEWLARKAETVANEA